MKKRLALLLISLLLTQPTLALEAPEAEWTPVGEGIEFRVYHLPDPNNVFVARMDRSNVNATIESSIAHGGLSGSVETVSGMAAHAEQAINYWGGTYYTNTWGTRNDVIVAINGSYFNFSTRLPEGGQIHSGWYAKRFDDCGGYTGFAWPMNRIPFIGENIRHRPEKNIAVFPLAVSSMGIDGVNRGRNLDELVMYTPQYAESTLTNAKGVEVLVELKRPTMLLPAPDRYAQGYVRNIRINEGDTVVPFDHVVLSASGSLTETLLSNVSIGTEVRISQELTSLTADNCDLPLTSINWTRTFASVQGHYYFIKEGVVNPYEEDPNATDLEPRTAIAYNDQYIFFVVVDGRDEVFSIGMTVAELGDFILNSLGATHAVAQDGGGSSTMVINGEVVNNVYCNNYYCEGTKYVTYLPLVVNSVTPELLQEQAQAASQAVVNTYERSVPNGMMMVVAQAAQFTNTFTVGQEVYLREAAYVYTGPGTNFYRLVSMPSGTEGQIVESLSGLNGVYARWANWWRVDFGNTMGWVQESLLSGE